VIANCKGGPNAAAAANSNNYKYSFSQVLVINSTWDRVCLNKCSTSIDKEIK